MRLDRVLVERGIVSSRQRAKELVLDDQVIVDGKLVSKPSAHASLEAKVEILGTPPAYPSRAGVKLEKALEVFNIDVQNQVVLDVGASTGGFTSCLLQAGAQSVFAVDVGKEQLVPELRDDPRVLVFEQTNIRDLRANQLPSLVDLATIDVSFISLTKVFPAVRQFLNSKGQVMALIKPQFETDGRGLNKHGVIQDKSIHLKYLPQLINQLQDCDLGLLGFDYSPISGTKGNLEYLAHFQVGAVDYDATDLVNRVIRAGWNQ